ncbi:MAG: hypothetical protein QOE63_189 [Acidimicrobiaceae bacterium]|jgi:hypothetical protein
MGLFGRKQQDDDVVDLRPQPVPTKLEFGLPTRCPSCSQPGYLDSIDLTEKRMYQHCPVCFTKWETTEDELTSAS